MFAIPPWLSPRTDASCCCIHGAARGREAAQKASIRNRLLQAHASVNALVHALSGGKGIMSFEVVRHEHPNILVVNRQTYETYRFTVGDDGALAQDGPRSDLREARRTAIAFLARCAEANGSRP